VQLGVVLEGYEDDVIIAVTDPRKGLQRRTKWPPTIAEVVDACDAERNRLATQRRYAAMPKMQRLTRFVDRSPGRRAKAFVPIGNKHYERCVAISETADEADWKWGDGGIWISHLLFYCESPKPGKWHSLSHGS